MHNSISGVAGGRRRRGGGTGAALSVLGRRLHRRLSASPTSHHAGRYTRSSDHRERLQSPNHVQNVRCRTYGGHRRWLTLAHAGVTIISLHITTIPELLKLNIYLRARLPHRPAERIDVGAVRNPPRSDVILRRTAVARRRA